MTWLWVEGNSSTLPCREYSEPRNSQGSRLQAVLTDHVKMGPVTRIEVFKFAGTLVIEVQVPSQKSGNNKSWVRIARGNEQYARPFVPTETDHPNLEAMSSQQSKSRERPRAQQCKAAPKPKLISIGFSQRVWKLIPAIALTQRDCANGL